MPVHQVVGDVYMQGNRETRLFSFFFRVREKKKVVTAKPVAWTHRDSNPIPDEFVRSASPPRLYWIVTSVEAYLKPEITGKKLETSFVYSFFSFYFFFSLFFCTESCSIRKKQGSRRLF